MMPLLMSLLQSPNKSGAQTPTRSGAQTPVSNARAPGSEPPGTSTPSKGAGKRKLTESMLREKKEVDDLVKQLAKNVQAPQ
ncbi:hypothetical protein IscW_ISCW013591 [Ixodes scapularis]|uniref:Uncharacterized protein n=1 Tax=Ixodes scapularis TaxID=6945 RepID=B7QM51_IXOSC|nr:hypothetical protein IscW_ISCW013591 [Ixodes scapularis]|eukprot:XP_002416254.1 hypothetical protein IscW_ISCW013591 [Ixodes scapularis]